MIIHEKSSETASTPLRVERPLRNLADQPKATKAANVDDAERLTKETGGETNRLDKAGIEKVLVQANEELASQGVALKFSISEESEELQVEVRDATSDKVIRKIPSDEVVRLSRSIKDMAGVLMDKPA